MELYEDMDFYFTYKGTSPPTPPKAADIYRHTTGQSLGISSVIIIGYTPANGAIPEHYTVLVPWDRKNSEGLEGQVLRVIAGVNLGGIENKAQ